MITSRRSLLALVLAASAPAVLYLVRSIVSAGIQVTVGALAAAILITWVVRAIQELPWREPSRERTAASAMDVVTGIAEAWHRLGEGATYATVRGTARHVAGGLEIHDLSGVAFVPSSSIHAMQQLGGRFARGGTIVDGDVVVVTGPAWRRADRPAEYRGRAVAIELGDRGDDRVLVIRTAPREAAIARPAAAAS